ncbi:hypothetical protein EC991_008462 [Linnemannia zychae]|nr:hypothetical protein EC991_008462 [Linnemannia zychae]
MRQEVPDPSSPFSEASDVDDLLGYESEDLHEYPSDSDLPSYTTDIEHDTFSLASSSLSSPRHGSTNTSTVLAADSALTLLALHQLEQGPLVIPSQPFPLVPAEDMTPDSTSWQQEQQNVHAPDSTVNNSQSAPCQKDDDSHGDEHDFLLIDPRDAIADVSEDTSSNSMNNAQQDQQVPESIPEAVYDNATPLHTVPDTAARQEPHSTNLQEVHAGQDSTVGAIQLCARDLANQASTPQSPDSSTALISEVTAVAPRVHHPHTEMNTSEPTILESTEDHPSIRIKITGRELSEVASTKIQERIATNFILQHKHQHTSGIPKPCFVIESADSPAKVAQVEGTDLCVYVLPATGPTLRDAQLLFQVTQLFLPLLVLISTEEYLDPITAIDIRQKLASTLLRQPRPRQGAHFFNQQVHVILGSCFTMQDLRNIHIQRLVDGSAPIQASTFDPICAKWRVVKGIMDQVVFLCIIGGMKLKEQLTTGVGLFFVTLTVILAVLVGTNLSSGTFSQPSHAIIRQVDYVQNGRMGVTHVDFLTAKGTPFKGKHQHPFQVRILGDDKLWSIRGAPTDNALGVADPIVQDLGNGTFKIYVTLNKRHPRTALGEAPLSSWLCPTKIRHFMHIWFANGTRVPMTPLELAWPKRVAPPIDRVKPEGQVGSTFCTCSGGRKGHSNNCGANVKSFKTPPSSPHIHDRLNDFEDDEDEGPIMTWKDQLQRLSAPVTKHLSNDTVRWMSQQWGLLQPVLCDVHDMTHSALSLTLHSAKRLFFLFSSWMDQILGGQDYLATRGRTILFKAHQGAHQLKDRFFARYSESGGKNNGPTKARKEQNDLIVLLDEQFQSLKRSGQAAAESARFPTAETVLQKMDELMVEVEDQVEKLLKSKRVKAMADQLSAEEILKKADKILAEAEDRMEKVWKTERAQDVNRKVAKTVEDVLQTQFAQDVNKRVAKVMKSKLIKDAGAKIHRRVEHLASTPAGKKWMHRMEAYHRQRRDEERQRPWGWFRKRCQRAFNK